MTNQTPCEKVYLLHTVKKSVSGNTSFTGVKTDKVQEHLLISLKKIFATMHPTINLYLDNKGVFMSRPDFKNFKSSMKNLARDYAYVKTFVDKTQTLTKKLETAWETTSVSTIEELTSEMLARIFLIIALSNDVTYAFKEILKNKLSDLSDEALTELWLLLLTPPANVYSFQVARDPRQFHDDFFLTRVLSDATLVNGNLPKLYFPPAIDKESLLRNVKNTSEINAWVIMLEEMQWLIDAKNYYLYGTLDVLYNGSTPTALAPKFSVMK